MPEGHDYPPAHVEKIQIALEFIKHVREATLASQFTPEDLADLLHPREHESTPMDDPDLMLSLRAFVELLGSTQNDYEAM